MSYVTFKILHYAFVNNAHSLVPTVVTDWFTPQIVTNLGDSKDQFSFKINNFNRKYDGIFNPRDKIVVYRTLNGAVETDADILMVGLITDSPETISSSMDQLKIKGYNHSETLMNAIVFMDPLTSSKTIPQAIEEGLQRLSVNPAFKVTWKSTNPSVKYTDGSDFPVVAEKIFYKTMKYVLEKYSGNTYTEDGSYYWYINNNNELVWDKEKDENEEGNFFDATTDTKYTKLSIGKNTNDVKNYAIIKGGYDPYFRPITGRYADYASASKHGIRFQYITNGINYIGDIVESDISTLETVYGVKATGKLPSTVAGFSYPYTFSWMSYNPTVVSATSDSDYVDKLRVYTRKVILTDVGKLAIDAQKNGKLELKITVKAGNKSWRLGSVVNVTVPNTSLGTSVTSPKNLRIQEITYGIAEDIYTLAEDTTKGSI